jgi:hypothetical protein
VGRRANRRVRRGNQAADAKRWDEAARHYRAALAVDDGPADLHYRLGRVLEHQRNRIGAAHHYRAAIARDAQAVRPHYRLGQVLKDTGQWEGARAAHRRATQLGPSAPPALEGRRGTQLPYAERIELGLLPKSQYGYGLWRAARTAARLGVPRISVVELGVAGGRGLLALEAHVTDIESMFDVRVEVYGFDTGEGMLASDDYRDLPHHFAEGNYAMDEAALRSRLTRAQLILGDASVTFTERFDAGMAPLGFVSFDMDHYLPTAAVLARFGESADHARFLPRVPLYFDDVVGNRGQDYNEYTGELLAIAEFNGANDRVKVAEDRYFRALPLNLGWHHGCYTMHRFDHPQNDVYVHNAGPRALGLKS